MPMTEELSGLPTSLSPDLIGDWNRVIRGILSHAASTGPNLNTLLAAAPDFALGQAIRGLSCLLLGRAEMISVARQAFAAALQGKSLPPCARSPLSMPWATGWVGVQRGRRRGSR
jgi:hypothetical protein